MSISPKHYEELKASGLSDGIIEHYFYSVDGSAAQDWLIGDRIAQLEEKRDSLPGHAQQYATAPVIRINKQIERIEAQSEHVKAGGWICTANGQIKPDEQRQATVKDKDSEKYLPEFDKDGNPKLIKYETRLEPLVEGGKSYRGAHISLMQPEGEAIRASDGTRLIVINEGGKKAGATATLGYESIGLPGVDMGSFKADGELALIPALAELAAEGCTFAISFDQDKQKAKRRGVAMSRARLAVVLEALGCKVFMPVWSHKDGKGIDDLLMAKDADVVHEAITSAKSFDAWKASLPKSWFKAARPAGYKLEMKRLEGMHAAYNAKPQANITLNQRFLDKGKLPEQGSIALLDSPMSTGKTSSYLSGIMAEWRAKHPGSVAISSAYRNILLRQSGAALNFTHWLDTDGDPSLAKFGCLAACPESLPKLASQKIPNGSLLLIDEVVAWLRHIFTSDTMKNGADRIAVLNSVRTLLDKVLDGGGYVIGLEAGIPQWAIDCLRELAPEGTPLKLTCNEFKLQANQKAYFHSKLTAFKSEQEAIVQRGARIVAASDSATQVDLQYRMMFDSAKDFHISAKNSADDDAQTFASNPQAALIARDGLRVLSYSPTIGAGVSIDDAEGREPWFDAKTGAFTHLNSSDAAQQLARYRRFVPIHIYCQVQGRGVGDSDLSIFDPQKLRERWNEDAKHCHALVDFAAYLSEHSDEGLLKTLERSLAGEIKEIAALDKWRSIIAAADNFDKLHLRANLEKRLEADGYEIVAVDNENIPGKSEEYKALKEQAEAESGEEFAAVEVPDTMSPDEAQAVLSTHGHSRLETLQARKCKLQFEFPEADFNDAKFCENWLIKNKGKKLSQLRTESAARNPEATKSADRWHLKNKLKQAKNLSTGVSMADVSQFSPQADVFAKAQIPQAIDAIGTELYGNDHPEVVRVASWADENKPLLKKVFRMRFDEERSNLDIFNSMARKLGYQPAAEKMKGGKGKQQKQYILADFCNPNRGHMLKALSDKFAAKLEQKGELPDGKPVNAAPDWGVDSEVLEARQAAAKPEPVKAVEKADIFEPWVSADANPLNTFFEADLIDARSFDELLAAKAKASTSIQQSVMKAWQSDGRYEWLKAKAEKLRKEAFAS